MKETKIKVEQKIEVVKQAEQKRQDVFLGKQILKKGHSVWEFNRDTLEIKIAERTVLPSHFLQNVKTNNLAFFSKHKTKSVAKINIKTNCIYIQCLNIKNVKKILKRNYNIDA